MTLLGSFNISLASYLRYSAPEHGRLNEQHIAFTELMHGHVFHSPLINPHRILDVGCGTGVVSCVFGQTFPSAHVYGVDHSLVPAVSAQPKNVSFIQGVMPQMVYFGDSEIFAEESFDLVFSRLVTAGMVNWQAYMNTALKLVKPGGYVEAQELAMGWLVGEVPCDQNWEWASIFKAEARNQGMDMESGKNMRDYMRNAGLEVVEIKTYKWPWGTWLAEAGQPETRRLGDLSLNTSSMFDGMIARLLKGKTYSEQRIAELQAEANKNLCNGQDMYLRWYVTIGRKPL